jgi:hypothetical protein
MKSEGIRTLVRKLRLCQSGRGRSRTRVERLAVAPSADGWRTTFRRLFFGKRIGTCTKGYRLARVKQPFAPDCQRLVLPSFAWRARLLLQMELIEKEFRVELCGLCEVGKSLFHCF